MGIGTHTRWHLRAKPGAGLLVSLAMALLSLSVTSGHVAWGDTPVTATSTSTLAAKSRKDMLPSELARIARDAIINGRYEAASQVGEAVLTKSRITPWRYYPFASFIDAISPYNDARFETGLSQWVSVDQKAALPTLIRAQFLYNTAWSRRGHGFINETRPADFIAFQGYLQRARSDVERAIELDGTNPYAYYLKLVILRGLGDFSGEERFLEQAIAKFPDYYRLYDEGLMMREPRWGGSVLAMRQFADRYAGSAEPHSPLKVLYVSLYRSILVNFSIACSAHFSDGSQVADCVSGLMNQQAGPDLEQKVVAALQVYDHADHYEFGLVIKEILLDMLQAGGGETYAGAVLQLAASAMHSDTQLVENNSGHNDYVIDAVVAQSWYWKGFYDNAISKNLEALADIAKNEFPDDAARDLATSTIYLQMLEPLTHQSRFDEVIAYARAAVDLGNHVDWGHYICYAYYQKREYQEALPECTKAVDDYPGNMLARFWRGQVYKGLGNLDAALNDLMVVADSQNGMQAYAAIDVSWIYDTRKELGKAIDSLDRYAYLFDEKLAGKDNVAIAYNNRCYAYMQLGELRKALDDCTQSLKYGSIPDAFNKQQELVKRLKVSEKQP